MFGDGGLVLRGNSFPTREKEVAVANLSDDTTTSLFVRREFIFSRSSNLRPVLDSSGPGLEYGDLSRDGGCPRPVSPASPSLPFFLIGQRVVSSPRLRRSHSRPDFSHEHHLPQCAI
jgi:hypothetical protein